MATQVLALSFCTGDLGQSPDCLYLFCPVEMGVMDGWEDTVPGTHEALNKCSRLATGDQPGKEDRGEKHPHRGAAGAESWLEGALRESKACWEKADPEACRNLLIRAQVLFLPSLSLTLLPLLSPCVKLPAHQSSNSDCTVQAHGLGLCLPRGV